VPYQGFSDGLYLLKQKSQAKGVDHYGIMDIGNRLNQSLPFGAQPVVVHQTPPSLRMDWLQNTGQWEVMGRITDEPAAIARINEAAKTPNYDLFGNNCEHFARYAATGRRESTQLQTAVVVAGLAALTYIAVQPQRR
jgi:hypothetical protein